MELEDKILSILKECDLLRAKDIAKRLSEDFSETVDSKEINQCLYYRLKGKVAQNSQYQWSINIGTCKQNTHKIIYTNTPLARLSSYYLECLSRDIEAGIWRYASSTSGSPEYGQLYKLPKLNIRTEVDLFNTTDVQSIINKVRKDRNKLSLQLGYPIHRRQKLSKSGKPFYIVEPLLIMPFDTNSFINGDSPTLINEIPRFNFEAIKNISGLDRSELINEVIELSDELGLNNSPSEQPNIDELVIRLHQLRPQWNWKETITPGNLTNQLLKEGSGVGVYNAAAVFYAESSKYTQGLETELNAFKKLDPSEYRSNALGQWVTRKFPEFNIRNEVLIEPLPLNEEQKSAVKRALQAPLTVVTGPPGTGKSQVVTSIIINAIYQGQTVIFSSRNHKAVDVVSTRVNDLTSRPVMLRLGSTELQAELAKYLSGILAANTSPSDYENYNHSKDRHEELTKSIESFNLAQADLINIRNTTDQLERNIEKFRELFSNELFYKFKSYDDRKFQEIETVTKYFENSLVKAEKNKQSTFVKLFWFLFQESRLQSIRSQLPSFIALLSGFEVDIPELPIEEGTLKIYFEALLSLKKHIEYAKEVSKYFKSLELLKRQKSLFQLSLETKAAEDSISENSHELWESWLRLLPDKLTDENRQVLGDYTSLLNLIVKANTEGKEPDKKIWGKFYSLQAKVSNILSCWAVTSLSAKGKVPFESGFFDLVIIDEASQCDIASALPLLYRAKRAVIIGDDKQLKHINAINENLDIQLLSKYGLEDDFLSWSYTGNSLFGLAQTICSSNDIVVLKDHHRSHADIINFSNKEFYDNILRVATKYDKLNPINNEPTLRWIDIKGKVERPHSGGAVNHIEACEVVKELKRIVQTGYKGTIGVVSPFRAQANRINDLIHQDQALTEQLMLRDFLTNTVHLFQGDERDIMIFSPVISTGMSAGSLNFLSKTGNLFNVAITRARATLIIIGDKHECSTSGVKYMERFVEYVTSVKLKAPKEISNVKDFGNFYPKLPSTFSVSNWEKKLYEALYKKGIKTLPQYQVEQYALDLALFSRDRKLDIEVDGEKYHRSWDGELCKRDQLRNKRLIELGWDVQRFWVYEIRDDLDGCVARVEEWLNRDI